MFRVAPPLELKKLETLFRYNVFKMLLAKGKITRDLIAMHSSWKHSGFHVFCGNRISPNDDKAMENLARYIIRASFSQERMQYLDQEGTVVYTGKDRKTNKVFEHLGIWLVRSRPPPKIHDPPILEYAAADLQIQPLNDTIYGDPEYTWGEYIQS